MIFSVLTVCTGNICRSPAVEYLLQAALGEGVRVSSAGTHGLIGHGVDAQMAALLPTDTSAFVARRLTPAMVKEADLILTLTRAHRGQAAELHPAAVRKVFTLREFARIASLADPVTSETSSDALAELTQQAPTLRVSARATTPADDDIADPFRSSDEVFAACFAEITEAVDSITRAVQQRSPTPTPSWWTEEAI